MSSVLAGGPPPGEGSQAPPPSPPTAGSPAQAARPSDRSGQRNNTLTVIAGVGVLLLAMGIGVLIGRSGGSGQGSAPAQVISVSSTPAAGAATTPSAEVSFTDDWPAGMTGYTVELQTLPSAATSVSAVEAAKSAASAKGAKAVGALKSQDFSSLTAGSFVIYSGVFRDKAEADKALPGLRKSFPGAKVVAVDNGGSSASGGGSGSTSGNVGSSESHPAPPSVLKSLKSAKGKSYEEKSKSLPDVVETG